MDDNANTAEVQEQPQDTTTEDEVRAAFDAIREQPEQNTDTPAPSPETEPETTGDQAPGPEATDTADTQEPPPAAEDADLHDLPPENPTRDDWREMRKRYADLKRKLKAPPVSGPVPAADLPPSLVPPLDTQQSTTAPAPTKETAAQQPGETPKLRADFVLDLLAQMDDGTRDDTYRRDAEQWLTNDASPEEVQDVWRRARAGEFGERSDAVADLARQWLPMAQVGAQKRERETLARQQAERDRADAWNAVLKEAPELRDTQSPAFREFREAANVLATEIPNFWQTPRAPYLVAELRKMRRAEAEATELRATLAKTAAEVNALRKRLGIEESPGSGGSAPTGKGHVTAEDELRAELRTVGLDV